MHHNVMAIAIDNINVLPIRLERGLYTNLKLLLLYIFVQIKLYSY